MVVKAETNAEYVPLEATRIDKIFPPNKLIKDKLDDKTAYNLLHQRASTGRHGRDPVHLILEKLWFVSIAHYVGLHSFDSFEVLQNLDPNLVVEDAGYTANHIFRLVMSNIARKSQAQPNWDVIPNSPDHVDQEAAKVGKQLLDWVYKEKKLKKLRRMIAFWTETCGTAFLYTGWDETQGKKQRVYKDLFKGTPLSTNDLLPRELDVLKSFDSFDDSSEGDIELEVVSPFQVKLPHWFVDFDKMPWVVIERIVPIDWIWEHYPKHAPHIQPDEITTNEDNEYWRRLSSLVNRHGFALPSRGGFEYEGVQIREMWIKPMGRFPRGAKIVGTMSRLLENSVHPYKEAGLDIDFPLVDFHHARVPGRFWSMGTVEHLIGPQREYNRARTQVILQRDVLANPQWIAPKNAELTNTRNEYGDILQYSSTAGGPPQLVNPPSLSQAHVSTIQDSLSDMQVISAQSDPSLGNVPTGVRSGVAIKALQERDSAVSGPTIEDMEDAFETVGTQCLQMFWKFASVPRAVQIYGESRSGDVQMFKGADLMGNTTVRVQTGSMMPKSRAATESTLMDLLSMGGLNPAMNPADRRILFEALEVGDIDKIFLEENLQRRRARVENEMFNKPAPGPETGFPDVDEDDDHQAHFEEHLKYKLTDSFERLPFIRKLAFNAHMDKHKQAVAAMMEAQATFAAIGAGGGGGGSPPAEKGEPSPTRERQPTPGSENQGSTS
jgi:hypothetical protein